jgi:hypothetical protein
MRRAFAALLLAGCVSTPATTVKSTDARPGLAFAGAPAGSQLFVDGNALGDATIWNGQPAVLRVEAGTHQVEVRDAAGRVLFRQRVFVESETKTLQVH